MLRQAEEGCAVEQRGSSSSSSKQAAQLSSPTVADDDDIVDDDIGWKALKSKKELRRERKKRKLIGLSALMMLNEQEGLGSSRKRATQPNGGENDHLEEEDTAESNNNLQNGANGGADEQLMQILANNNSAYVIGGEEHEQEEKVAHSVEAKRRREESNGAAAAAAAAEHDNAGTVKCKPLGSSGGTDKVPAATAPITDSEYRALKAYVSQKKSMRYIPRVLLKPIGQDAVLDRKGKNEERIPLLLDDLQALLMHTFLRTDSPVAPRWVSIDKSTKLTHTTVLIVEGFSCEDYVTYREHMRTVESIFGPQHTLQVVCPWTKLLEEVACVPLSDTHKDVLVAEYGSLEAAMRICKDQMLVRKSVFRNIAPPRKEDYSQIDLPEGDKFPRTLLLLSPIQMINEGYPIPLAGTLENKYKKYVTTSDAYKPVNPRSPMYGIDCEMCGVAGGRSVLTRVSIVDEKRNVIYNELVQPYERIVDYRTKFSGITPKMLQGVRTTLADVQQSLRKLLPPDAILVGHSLNSDLLALEMLHPYVIDTSIIYNVTGNPMHKQKLKILTKKFLDQDIQCENALGHDSIEDCAASLELVQLKLSNSIYFGDQWLEDRRKYHSFRSGGQNGISQLDVSNDLPSVVGGAQQAQITATLFSHAKKRNKRSVIVTNAQEELRTFEKYFGNAIGGKRTAASKWLTFCKTETPAETITRTASECLQYDFNLAYVRLPNDSQPPREGQQTNVPPPSAPAVDKKTLATEIDGWVSQLYKGLSVNGLLVVLLVGGEDRRSGKNHRMGVAMVQTKKPPK